MERVQCDTVDYLIGIVVVNGDGSVITIITIIIRTKLCLRGFVGIVFISIIRTALLRSLCTNIASFNIIFGILMFAVLLRYFATNVTCYCIVFVVFYFIYSSLHYF